MRGRLVLALSAIVLVAAFAASAADVVVLKDGRSISLAKPLVTKGKVAILTLPDKTVLSVPIAEIDKQKTADARARLAAPPVAPAPSATARPLTPAEAAKVKSTKKAVVSLTDESVAHPTSGGGEGGASGEESATVELGPVTVKRETSGYNVTGTLMNTGKGEAVAVTLTIEGVADDGKVAGSTFASLAKDTLTSGEKTSFTATVPSTAAINTFNYSPRWREKAPARMSVTGNGQQEQGSQQKPAAGQGAQGEGTADTQPAAPPPAKAEEPKPVQRGDVAAPPANAPVGQPTEPGGVYAPQPSPEGQPKLP